MKLEYNIGGRYGKKRKTTGTSCTDDRWQTSNNRSVAAGICIYEVVRQKNERI